MNTSVVPIRTITRAVRVSRRWENTSFEDKRIATVLSDFFNQFNQRLCKDRVKNLTLFLLYQTACFFIPLVALCPPLLVLYIFLYKVNAIKKEILSLYKPFKHLYFQQKKDTRQVLILPVLYPNLWIVFVANFVNSICYKLTNMRFIPILLQRFL